MDPTTLAQLEASITGLINRIIQQSTIGSIPLATETVNGLTRLANNLTSTDTDRALTAEQGRILKGLLDQVNSIIASNDVSLNTLQKVVDYIKINRSSIDTLNNSVSLIELELINVVRTNDSRLTDAREWSAATISQAEAEAGTATTRRAFTAQRVRQSIAAYTQPFTAADRTKLDGIQAGAQANVATNLSYTAAATNGVVVSSTGTNATLPAATTSQAGLLTGADKTKLDGIQAGAQVNAVTSVSSRTGAILLTKADVGLSNVDNTADSAKSVANAAALTTARTINGTSFNGTANITTINWGTVRDVTIGGTTRSVDGSTNVSWSLADIGALGRIGAQMISKTVHASNTDNHHLELHSPEGSFSGEVSLRFHQSNRFYGQIRMRADGFHFTQGHNGQYRDIFAGTFNGSLASKGWRRFHLATNEATPQPPASAGPGRWFVRLNPTNTTSQTFGGRVIVNGGWSWSPIMGICEKQFSLHYDDATGTLSAVDNRISALTGSAADHIRIGDITIVGGFVGFYVWVSNTNVPFIQLDLYNYTSETAPTLSGWESDAFPIRTPVTYFDLDISGSGRNIHFRSSPLGVRRGIIGQVANNDFWSVYGGGDVNDAGYLDIATGDNGNEPIYVSQFSGGSPIPVDGVTTGSLIRRAALLNAAGNTSFPGTVTSSGMFCNGAFHQAEGVSTGTVNGAQANVWQINDPGSTRTVTITNTESMLGSLTYILRIVGNRATNWPANVNWSDGVAPILGPNWTIVVLTRINATWFGSIGPSR